MSEPTPILSIIIPVYKVEAYIADTLRSCLDQDIPHEDYEIICIDDGSPDRSAEIIAEMAAEHPNIRLIRRDNHGVSATRNFGLDEARGTYIWFVDSDDLVLPHCISFLMSIIEKEKPDYLQFMMRQFTDTPPDVARQTDYEVCADAAQMYDFLYGKGGGGVCRLILRADIIRSHHIRFAEHIRYSEDVLFAYEAMMSSQKVAKTSACCYFYRQRPGSAMHSQNLKGHSDSMLFLADAYHALADACPASWRPITLNKRDFATKALLFSLMQLGNASYAKQILKDVTKKGYYPYPLKMESLKGNETRKQAIINGISFLFPFKWYFLTCVRLHGLLKGKKI